MTQIKNKRSLLLKNVFTSWRQKRFRRVIVTVSGGADSVALLAAITTLPEVEIIAAHCNFHLRGNESMRDQNHVENICRQLDVNLTIKDFDVPAYISLHKGKSLEMACRELRYEWFRELLKSSKADRMATGHNADDNIETMFLNLFRGSGTTGLKGMVEDTGEIWRPLLTVHRKEILSFLEECQLPYITDSSNLTSDFRRNFLRNEVLPLLRSRWEGLDKSLDRSIALLRNENKIVNTMVSQALPGKGMPLLSTKILEFPDPELLIRRYIAPLSPFTTTSSEILASLKANKPDIKYWQLPKGTVILRGGKLYIKSI